MKAGGDKDGIWALFESGIQCVSALSPLFVSDTFLSASATTAHIPYVRPILHTLTGNKGALTRFLAFGRERVLQRLEAGATRKDLFYHLVRRYTEPNMFTSLRLISERRRTP